MQQILQFLREVRTEFGNISWPKRDSLIQLTFVVISVSLIISLILGGFDYIFTQSFNLLAPQPQVVIPTIQPQITLVPTITQVTLTPTKKPNKK